MNEYQADMAHTAIYKDKIIYPAFGLVNEAGEVAGKLKKIMRDEHVSVEGFVLTDKQRADVAANSVTYLVHCGPSKRSERLSK